MGNKVKSKEQHIRVLDNLTVQKANGELLNKSKAIKDAGYSDATAHNPDKVIATKGFQQLLEEQISDKTIIDYLKADLEAKEGNRLGELKLACELKGKLTNRLDISVHKEVDEQLEVMKEVIDGAKEGE